jgi:hypothetical protein
VAVPVGRQSGPCSRGCRYPDVPEPLREGDRDYYTSENPGARPQGFPGGEDGFDALLEALQNDAIYGNVHTDKFPSGEIRGQFRNHGND